MEYRRSEIRAGVFLLISFVILVVMIFAVSDIQSLFKKKKAVKVLFLFSDGIEKHAQVRFSGIKIGKVENIRVAPEKGDKIELTLSVFREAVIKEDTKAAIKSLGIVGGKYVELSGGTPQSRMLESDSTIIGQESLKLEDLSKMALDVVAKLNNMATNLDNMLGDPKISKSLRATIQNLQDASENIKVMTSSKDEVAQGLKDLPAILKKTDDILKKTEDVANNLKAITEKSDKMIGENKKNIDATLESFREVSKNLKDITDDVKAHPWKLIRKP